MSNGEETILNVETVNREHIAQSVNRTIVQLVRMVGPQHLQNPSVSPNAILVRLVRNRTDYLTKT